MDVVDHSNDSSVANTSHNVQSDNSFNNRSSISVYSAEEQIIQQRGRRSPKKKSFNDLQQQFEQLQQHLQNHQKQHFVTSRDLFLKIKQISMRSPDAKKKYYNLAIEASGKRKSLLRTPVKRRLRRHVDILPKLRKSDKRRK